MQFATPVTGAGAGRQQFEIKGGRASRKQRVNNNRNVWHGISSPSYIGKKLHSRSAGSFRGWFMTPAENKLILEWKSSFHKPMILKKMRERERERKNLSDKMKLTDARLGFGAEETGLSSHSWDFGPTSSWWQKTIVKRWRSINL